MRITASAPTSVRITAAINVDAVRRTLVGTVYRYGETGQTSAGPLQVGPSMPPPPIGLPMSREHDRGIVRGSIAMVDAGQDGLRVAVRVVDGELGDQAIAEAQDRTRAAFSLDIEDAVVVDGVIVSGRWEALGQVETPAFNSARIDQIAASFNPGETMTPEQRARLAELAAMNNRSAEEETEFQTLQAQAVAEATATQQEPAAPADPAATTEPPATQAVAASMPAVPSGVPAPETAAQTSSRPRGTAYQQMVAQVSAALALRHTQPAQALASITAALADITNTAHTSTIEQPAWSGELWSGLEYEIEWSDLLAQDTLTHWKGQGWRFTQKLEIQDYAGDKAAIPTGNVTTEESRYEAARMAIGVDIDRKFFDFDSAGDNSPFVNALFTQVRESWEIKKDVKARAFILANAVAGTRTANVTTTNASTTVTAAAGTFSASDVGATIVAAGIPAGATIAAVTNSGQITLSAAATASATVAATIGAQAGTLLKAAARASLILKRRRVGRASWIVVNDEDMFSLLDVAEKDIPAFLELWNIDPKNFRSSADVPRGTVMAGAKQAAKFRQLPGSPIRVDAQNLVNGGIDEAFFGYWAIEEHHTSGLVTVGYRAPA